MPVRESTKTPRPAASSRRFAALFRTLVPYARALVTVDLRALALLRVSIAALILWDVSVRWGDATALYSDQGVEPRARVERPGFPPFALYFLRGEPEWTQVLLALTGVAALALLLGYRARLSALLCWVMVAALHARNGAVLQAGDSLLRQFLLWLTLLPSGARFGLDERATGRLQPGNITGPATLPLYVQLALLYFVTGTMKAHHANWQSGEAVYNALSADYFVTGFGQFLYPHWYLLKALTYGTLALEILGPFVLLFPPRFHRVRTALVLSFVGFHLGITATMRIGMFSFVCVVAWLFVLPTPAMDRFEAALRRLGLRRADAGLVNGRPEVGPAAGRFASRVAAVAVVYMVLATMVADRVRKGRFRELFLSPVEFLSLEEQWGMFVKPRSKSGWLVVDGRLESGGHIDPRDGGRPLSWRRPPLVVDTFANQRWRKLLAGLSSDKRKARAERYLDWLCRGYNANALPGRRLWSAELLIVEHKVGRRYDHGPDERRHLARRSCPR